MDDGPVAMGACGVGPPKLWGAKPSHDPPMAPQIKQQNRGFLNFGSFLWRAACSRGVGVRAAAASSPHQLHAIRPWLHFSASQFLQLLLIHSADFQMCELSVYFVLTRAEFDTLSRDDRNSQQHTASRLMIA